jgi:predicted GTPase
MARKKHTVERIIGKSREAEVRLGYPHNGRVSPAVGYRVEQTAALERTIGASDAKVVVAATPIDLASLVQNDRPVMRAGYEFAEAGEPSLGALVDSSLARAGLLGD